MNGKELVLEIEKLDLRKPQNIELMIYINDILSWQSITICKVTNIVFEEDMIFISNAFSNEDKQLEIKDLCEKLRNDERDIYLEVYSCNFDSIIGKWINNQIYIEKLNRVVFNDEIGKYKKLYLSCDRLNKE